MQAKWIVIAGLTAVLPLVAQQPQTVTCSSQNGAQQVCPANTRDGVLLLREQSGNVCRQGSTWSYDRQGITVNGGCSADFLVSGRGGRNGGYGNNGYNSNNGSGYNNNGNGYGNGAAVGAYGNGSNNNGLGAGGAVGAYGNNAPNAISIPQGTQISMQLDQTVRLSELNQGDFITGTMVNPLLVNGRTVAPAGTPLQAKVNTVGNGQFDLRLDSFHVDNQTYVVQTTSVRSLRDAVSTGADTSGRGFNGVLGALANAGSLPAGTVFNFRLTATARPTTN